MPTEERDFPMSDTQTLEADIAFLRRMAEEGRKVTAPGGPYYFAWGLAIAAGYLAMYLYAEGVHSFPIWATWLACVIPAYLATMLISARDAKRVDANRFVNRVSATVWIATGIGMTVFWIGTAINGNMGYMAPVASIMCGVAFGLIGAFARIRFMYLPAAAWFVTVPIMFTLSGSNELPLAMSVFVLVNMAGTGLVLTAMERKARA